MKARVKSQNTRLRKYLDSGKKIHCFSPARRHLRIGYLNSRCSDLKKDGYPIGKEWVTVKDVEGNKVRVVCYFRAA